MFAGEDKQLCASRTHWTCREFFYNGDKTVGKLFPEVLQVEVLRVTVAIAATTVTYTLTLVTCS